MSQEINLKQTAELLQKKDDFAVICHASPDGDTLGGVYALCGALQKMQKRAKVVLPDAASTRFNYLKDAAVPQEFDEKFTITVDVADSVLLGSSEKDYKDRISLCIDHHVSNTRYADNLLLDSDAAAACEVVYMLIKELSELHGKDIMTKEIAACLYTGISTDTGCFRFSNTTANTHRITAELMEYSFDCAGLNYLLFDMRTKERVELERQALEGIEFAFDGKCAVITLTKEMLDNADDEDVNAIGSLPRQIDGVEAGVTFKERKKDEWKVSIRTKNYIDARQICAQFGGGGHQRAAGCRIKGSLSECKERLLKVLGLSIR
ncbi:MAG: bifunctional oligoribonuclease/PAP phosphatase NrnA [Oscillospiraceae bacterium]|nr:bifunctional oligoribonuclease/PAP phosphatase NrnA [Oscillospiraceae bacterium]